MGSQPEKILQHRAVERVRLLNHLFDRDPENPAEFSAEAKARPLPEGAGCYEAVCDELLKDLESPFAEVRRLAASALGKMAPAHPPGPVIVPRLLSVAAGDANQQVRQYAAKAIGQYAADAFVCIEGLKDVARDVTAAPYVRTAAAETIALIETERQRKCARLKHWCTRCKRIISEEEYFDGIERWGNPYCRHCLDERDLEDRNFEATVEGAKVRRSQGGVAVQSRGEKRIAEFLEGEGIEFVYDERYRIAGDVLVRPDFYLPEFDLYIEYFGMDTPEYRDNMLKKKILYQRAAKKLISVSYKDYDRLTDVLKEKLSRHINFDPGRTFTRFARSASDQGSGARSASDQEAVCQEKRLVGNQ